MRSKMMVVLALWFLCATGWAAPSYQVTFEGEAPVRVTLDGAGRAEVESVASVQGKPAVRVELAASGTSGQYLLLRVQSREAVEPRYTSELGEFGLSGLDTWVYEAHLTVLPAERLDVFDPALLPDEQRKLASVTRLE